MMAQQVHEVPLLFERKYDRDNEVDLGSFLKRMVIEKTPAPALTKMMLGALGVVQQMSLVGLVFISYLVHDELEVHHFRTFNPFVWTYATALGSFLLWEAKQMISNKKQSNSNFQQVALAALLIAAFSPLLRTITESYSSDTVFLLAAICGVVHLYLFDYYSHGRAVSTRLDCTVSLNASFMMCLLFASRLEHSEQVASFLFSGILLLVVLPNVLLRLRTPHPSTKQYIVAYLGSSILVSLVVGLLLHFSLVNLASLFLFLVGFVLLVCPLLLRFLHRFKNVIRGPWDVVNVEEEPDD